STYSGFDSFSYKASNGTLQSTAATVTLTVVQQPPTAVADSSSTPTNTALNVNAASGVLANDSDPSHLTLHAVLVTNVSHGSLTLNTDGS
ncbi:Ig-like domain-containing protein, partial [Acinetobacter baumannii]